jgi:aminoglycoside 6'-N-acetyltransferase I
LQTINYLNKAMFQESDLAACAKIMTEVYNNDLWQCNWSLETAKDYLEDYVRGRKFLGYTIIVDNEIIGAIFAHEKIWWNNNEIFVDEMFISPSYQRQGYGTELLKMVENYIKEHKLAGFTLTTNRYAPAPAFYRKNGFVDCEHVLYMGKCVE